MINLNVGASPIWHKPGWSKLDHKVKENTDSQISGDAVNIALKENSCSTIFCSHMFEHVPHVRLERILLEFNRVLDKDGVLRILTPDLLKIATAYVAQDVDFFNKARSEDETIRTDLGFGGMFMNFMVSPGQDTALFTRDLGEFIAGYAHLYSYDFFMLKTLLERTGFYVVTQKDFLDSEYGDYQEPLHVVGMDPVWQDFNQDFYKKNGLIHYYDTEKSKYIINFEVTGFDRDPLTSLIIEARKKETVEQSGYKSLNESKENYNQYAWSLMRDEVFAEKYEKMKAVLD
jgi:hypothetical protein